MTKMQIDFARLAPPPGSRIAIVGGCGGIGRALVDACLALELKVAVLDLATALSRGPFASDVLTVAADASNEGEVGRGFTALADTWGGLDILVFVTGIAIIPPVKIDELDVAQWDRLLDINLRSAFLCARAALPMMKPHGGSIVTISSSLAFNPNRGFGAYVASKGGLVSLTKAIAAENGPIVRANIVAPSAVDTPFLAGGSGQTGGSDTWFKADLERYVSAIPLQRLAVPDDVVGPILFLAGPGARYITGQTLHVNGGRITP
jgi:NAD(P)-dependent dehydrogenase (short-subunit alcohol dehydrogenase family)